MREEGLRKQLTRNTAIFNFLFLLKEFEHLPVSMFPCVCSALLQVSVFSSSMQSVLCRSEFFMFSYVDVVCQQVFILFNQLVRLEPAF